MDVHGEDDCAFCLGREAAHRGEPRSANPFVRVDARVGSLEWYDSDFGLWDAGHDLGANETSDHPWYAQRGPD